MRRRWQTFVAVIALVFAAGICPAATVFGTSALGELVGSRSEQAGSLTTGGNWLSDGLNQSIAWNIAQNPVTFQWTYIYTFTNFSQPAISHVIMSLSDDCLSAAGNALADPGCVTNASGSPLQYSNAWGPAPSNPGFPVGQSIKGVKFDFGGESPFQISFNSNREPVYGHFYTKGGNDSFAFNPGLANPNSMNILDFIPRPDGVIPEPSTWLMLGGGLAWLGLRRRRQKA